MDQESSDSDQFPIAPEHKMAVLVGRLTAAFIESSDWEAAAATQRSGVEQLRLLLIERDKKIEELEELLAKHTTDGKGDDDGESLA